MNHKPKLRPLNFQPLMHQGQPMWLINDPLQLTGQQLVVPQSLTPLLIYCDGSRDTRQLHADFCQHIGEQIEIQIVTEALAQLDRVCFLDNERSQQARRQVLAEYHAQPFRPPALADLSYPGEPDKLRQLLTDYGQGDALNGWEPWHGRGIISPHIDYHRGGPVYAQVWRRAETAVLEADLVLILGTDHNGSYGSVTLTRQPYATPFGVLPTDLPLIDRLAEALGPEAAFAEELHHRQEHSVELSAVWLHYLYQHAGRTPSPMVPILCGSFHHFVTEGGHPAQDSRLTAVIDTLKRETAAKKVLVVASVDLAHVGPDFGDPFNMTPARRTTLRQSDAALMQTILQGDAADFYRQIANVQDQNRICGFSAIYLLLRYLENQTGHQIAYTHCPADAADNSLVSICGLLLD